MVWTLGTPIQVFITSLARTPGWWERSHIGLATKDQLKRIREWLDNGVRSTWRPVKLGEGSVRFEHAPLEAPTVEDVEWDGATERVSVPAPAPTGPLISLDELLVVVHTARMLQSSGAYRTLRPHASTRLPRGSVSQGSSHRWDEILTLK